MCTAGFSNANELLRHVMSSHASERHFTYSCSLSHDNGQCCITFKTAYAFKNHMYRVHSDLMRQSNLRCDKSHVLELDKIICSVCNLAVLSISELSSHYREHCANHLKVLCPIEGCCNDFTVYSSYTSHMTRHRQQQIELSIKKSLMKGKPEGANNLDCGSVDTVISDEHENDNRVSAIDYPTKVLALQLLNLQETCMLPCSTVQRFCDLIQDIVCVSSSNAKNSVYCECNANNVSLDVAEKLTAAAGKNGLEHAFSELDSVAKRKRYCSENLNFVEPKTICYVLNDVVNTESFQYIPVIDTLKVLLKNDGIRSQLIESDEGRCLAFCQIFVMAVCSEIILFFKSILMLCR